MKQRILKVLVNVWKTISVLENKYLFLPENPACFGDSSRKRELNAEANY